MKIVALGIGHPHSPIYIGKTPELGHELAGLHDDNSQIAAAKAERLKMPVDTDPAKLLDRVNPDFAFVMGSPRRMPELLRLVIERGIPFLAEKPAGRSPEEVRPLAEMAEKRGVFGAVAYCYRWDPRIQLIRQWIKEGRLGQLGMLRLQYLAGAVSRYEAMQSAWMADPVESGGGAIINVGVHALDVLQYWDLAPTFVRGAAARPFAQAPFEDFATLLLDSGGALTTVESGYSTVSLRRGLCVEILAEKANVFSISDGAMSITGADKKKDNLEFATPKHRDRDAMLKDLFALCRDGKPSPVTLADAVASLEIIEAFYRHIRQGS